MITCNGTNLAKGIIAKSPYLKTILEASRIPQAERNPADPT